MMQIILNFSIGFMVLWWRQTVCEYELYILMVDTPLHVKLKCVGVFDITSGMRNKVPGWNNTTQEGL